MPVVQQMSLFRTATPAYWNGTRTEVGEAGIVSMLVVKISTSNGVHVSRGGENRPCQEECSRNVVCKFSRAVRGHVD